MDLLKASIREMLWHEMRQDLTSFFPEIAQSQLLMCCCCGRFLEQNWFDLEHLIPQQSLKADPIVVQSNPDTSKNVRAGNLLLCKKPLTLNGIKVYNNGCNSWKGKHYDKRIRELISGEAFKSDGACTSIRILAALAVAYLAMVAEFGYAIVLTRSGLLMREQFFSPNKYHHDLPARSQLVLRANLPILSPDAKMWANPFAFGFERKGACVVTARNFGVFVPVSRDPREPFAKNLLIVPTKYKPLRPYFKAFFD
jgi:hypothetical protein